MKPKYEGEKNGLMREGRGRMWYNNGEVYEGEWKSDKVLIFINLLAMRVRDPERHYRRDIQRRLG